jgi:hypothetical protein
LTLAYDHLLVVNHQEASSFPRGRTLSTSPTASQDVCRAMPAHHERLNPFSTAGPAADQGTSMQARRRRRDLVPQSSNGNVTSARSDLVLKAFLSSSDDSPITMSRSSRLPLSQISNRADVSLARKDAKTQAVKRIPKLIPRPPPRLVPELQDHAFFLSDEAFLDKDDPPCASGKARKGGRPNDYRISSRPRDTPSPDCSLPGDSGKHVRFRMIAAFTDLTLVVPSIGCAAVEGQDHDFENCAFFIPLDCPTSTPVASKKRASRKRSAGSGGATSACADLQLATTRVIQAR